ncbi:MAG: elongator complex protein 3 [Proteocatella sp.]
MGNKKTISIFVPHSGCPNDCIFCNQKKITGVSSLVGPKEAEEIIIESLKTIPQNTDIEIAFFGGSFTAIERQLQEELLDVANKYKKTHNIKDIRLSTRPDAIDNEILEFLKIKGVTIIELGVQSLDEDVLVRSNRGHNSKCVYESSELILKNGFKLGLQMMLGLPGDDIRKVMYTAEEFIKIAPHFVRLYPVLVIKETGLESLFKSKVYEPWSIEQTVEACKEIYIKFSKNGIKVIRIGLQTSEDITIGKDVVAGPFHPSIGEMVYSRVYRELIEDSLNNRGIDNFKNKLVNIKINNRNISKLIGNKKSNKIYFKDKYNIIFNIETLESDDSLVVEGETVDISFLK